MENLRCLSYTHSHGDVQKIPKVKKQIEEFFNNNQINNFVFLKTCNRAESYFFSKKNPIIESDLINILNNKEAFEHLLEVVSGIDSMVVGETEILNQVRTAYNEAVENDRTDSRLRKLFDFALKFGKKARRKTNISSGKISVASIGLDRAKDILGKFRGKKAVVIGAGRMGRTTARYLKEKKVESIMVANRTYECAKELTSEIGGESYHLSKLSQLIKKAEIIICATGAPHYIVTEEKIPDLEEEKLLLDLSVPSNVQPSVRKNKKIKYISYENLTGKARENIARREKEIQKIKKMIEKEIKRFYSEDSAKKLYKESEKIRKEQLKKAKKEMKKRSNEEVLEDFSKSLMKKILLEIKNND